MINVSILIRLNDQIKKKKINNQIEKNNNKIIKETKVIFEL